MKPLKSDHHQVFLHSAKIYFPFSMSYYIAAMPVVNSTPPLSSKLALVQTHPDSKWSFPFTLSIPKALQQIKGRHFFPSDIRQIS